MSSYKFGKIQQNQQNNKIHIAVNYYNKDKVKDLKCRWDNESKVWYIMSTNITPEILEKLFILQDSKTIGLIKKYHIKSDEIKQNLSDSKTPYLDLGYKNTEIYELYTLEEIKEMLEENN